MVATGRVFDGLRVVDRSETLAGALASMHLADFGADVVRVETGSFAAQRRRASFLVANRNKHIVEASRRGHEVGDLIARCDAVIVDDQAGVLDDLGLDAATLRRRYPRLLHLWMPPHAERGAPAGFPESELLFQAWTGMADQQPSGHGDDPAHPAMALVQYEQGALAAAAMGAAVLHRARTGQGRAVTVSGLHAASALNIGIMLDLPGVVRPYGGDKMGASGISPNFSAYPCGDGRWIFLGCLTPAFLFLALEVMEAMEVMVLPGVDGDFAKLRTSQGGVHAILEAKFAERDSTDWLERFARAGVPSAPVETRAEWAASPTVTEGRLLVELPCAGLGTVRLPDVGVELSATPGAVRWLPDTNAVVAARDVWADVTTEADAGAGDSPGDVGALPLDGVRIIDASSFMAGPVTTTILGDFGATIIKLEQPTGDEFRVAGASYSVINHGKYQVTADLKTTDGRRFLGELLPGADVVLENMRAGVAERLGLDHRSVAAVNPSVITCAMSAWGAGPLERTPAFDPLIQARSGLMRAQGGEGDPVLLAVAVHDVGVATLSAFGVVAALVARERDGRGQEVRTSLSRTSLAFQAAEFTELRAEVEGGPQLEPATVSGRLHRCLDGWVAVAGRDEDGPAGTGPGFEVDVAGLTVNEATQRLRAIGAVAVPVLSRLDVFTAPALEENEFFATVDDPDFGPIKGVRTFAHWPGAEVTDRQATRALGQDSEAVRQRLWEGLGPRA